MKEQIPLSRKDVKVIFEDSQRRQFSMTPQKARKIRELMANNPEGGIQLVIGPDGQVQHIQGVK